MLEQEFTVANYQERSQNILPSKCVLIIPAGKHIALHVSGRVPVLHDDVIVDVPVNKTSVARGSLARDSKPEGSRTDLSEPGSKPKLIAPAFRIKYKSKIELTSEQKIRLDKAMDLTTETSISARTAATLDLSRFKSNCL